MSITEPEPDVEEEEWPDPSEEPESEPSHPDAIPDEPA
jgi:hypothetical protein